MLVLMAGDRRLLPEEFGSEELVRQNGGGGISHSSLTENLLGELDEITVINTNLEGLETSTP